MYEQVLYEFAVFIYRVFIDCEWRQKSPLQQDLFALYIERLLQFNNTLLQASFILL